MSSSSIAINGRFYGQATTGVQRYAREVVRALDDELGGKNIFVTLVTPSDVIVSKLKYIRHVEAGLGSGHLWEQTQLPFVTSERLLNLCNTAPICRVNQVVCIHDANVFINPESYSFGFRSFYKTILPIIASRSLKICTVSEDAAKQIAKFLPIAERDIWVLPNGHEHALSWSIAGSDLQADFGSNRPFILTLGSQARHKNLSLVLDLAPSLDEMGIDIVIAGGHNSIFSKKNGRENNNIIRLGKVSDDDLAFLMSRALCLAFPSLTEGFGLPILEAMARGCPVISSDRASMPEIAGDAALFAAPDAPLEWLEGFAKMLASETLRAELVGRGRERINKFSWKNTAAGYRALMLDTAPR